MSDPIGLTPPSHSETWKARLTAYSFQDLGDLLVRATGTFLESVNVDDMRYTGGAEYLMRLRQYLDEEIAVSELRAELGDVTRTCMQYGEADLAVRTALRGTYGSSDQLPTLANSAPWYDAETAFWVDQGAKVAAGVVANHILAD